MSDLEGGISFLLCIVAIISIIEIRSWWRRRKERREMENARSDDLQLFRAGHETQFSAIAPPLPVRPRHSGGQETQRNTGTVSPPRQNTRGQAVPPSLPNRGRAAAMNPEYFPKCPIHKCCNRRGENQKIFWNEQRNMWSCYHGHYFMS